MISDFSSVRDQGRGQNGLQLGELLVVCLVDQGVELFEHRRGLAGILRGAQQGGGVDVGNLLDADVGLDLGRDAGMFGGDVGGFRHDDLRAMQ